MKQKYLLKELKGKSVDIIVKRRFIKLNNEISGCEIEPVEENRESYDKIQDFSEGIKSHEKALITAWSELGNSLFLEVSLLGNKDDVGIWINVDDIVELWINGDII